MREGGKNFSESEIGSKKRDVKKDKTRGRGKKGATQDAAVFDAKEISREVGANNYIKKIRVSRGEKSKEPEFKNDNLETEIIPKDTEKTEENKIEIIKSKKASEELEKEKASLKDYLAILDAKFDESLAVDPNKDNFEEANIRGKITFKMQECKNRIAEIDAMSGEGHKKTLEVSRGVKKEPLPVKIEVPEELAREPAPAKAEIIIKPVGGESGQNQDTQPKSPEVSDWWKERQRMQVLAEQGRKNTSWYHSRDDEKNAIKLQKEKSLEKVYEKDLAKKEDAGIDYSGVDYYEHTPEDIIASQPEKVKQTHFGDEYLTSAEKKQEEEKAEIKRKNEEEKAEVERVKENEAVKNEAQFSREGMQELIEKNEEDVNIREEKEAKNKNSQIKSQQEEIQRLNKEKLSGDLEKEKIIKDLEAKLLAAETQINEKIKKEPLKVIEAIKKFFYMEKIDLLEDEFEDEAMAARRDKPQEKRGYLEKFLDKVIDKYDEIFLSSKKKPETINEQQPPVTPVSEQVEPKKPMQEQPAQEQLIKYDTKNAELEISRNNQEIEEIIDLINTGKIKESGEKTIDFSENVYKFLGRANDEAKREYITQLRAIDSEIRAKMIKTMVDYAKGKTGEQYQPEKIKIRATYLAMVNEKGLEAFLASDPETWNWLSGKEEESIEVIDDKKSSEKTKEEEKDKEEISLMFGDENIKRIRDAENFTDIRREIEEKILVIDSKNQNIFIKHYSDLLEDLRLYLGSASQFAPFLKNPDSLKSEIAKDSNENVKKYSKVFFDKVDELKKRREKIFIKTEKEDGKKPPEEPENVEKKETQKTSKEKLAGIEFEKVKTFIKDFKGKSEKENYDFIMDLALLKTRYENEDEYNKIAGKYIIDNINTKDRVRIFDSAAKYLRENNKVNEAKLFIKYLDALMMDADYDEHLNDIDQENLEWLKSIENKTKDNEPKTKNESKITQEMTDNEIELNKLRKEYDRLKNEEKNFEDKKKSALDRARLNPLTRGKAIEYERLFSETAKVKPPTKEIGQIDSNLAEIEKTSKEIYDKIYELEKGKPAHEIIKK